MAVHAPLLRDMACQDAMWSRAVAADSPDPDDPLPQGAQPQGSRQEQFVQEFSSESPARVQSQQAALNALAAERAHQYKILCDQVSFAGLFALPPDASACSLLPIASCDRKEARQWWYAWLSLIVCGGTVLIHVIRKSRQSQTRLNLRVDRIPNLGLTASVSAVSCS